LYAVHIHSLHVTVIMTWSAPYGRWHRYGP